MRSICWPERLAAASGARRRVPRPGLPQTPHCRKRTVAGLPSWGSARCSITANQRDLRERDEGECPSLDYLFLFLPYHQRDGEGLTYILLPLRADADRRARMGYPAHGMLDVVLLDSMLSSAGGA